MIENEVDSQGQARCQRHDCSVGVRDIIVQQYKYASLISIKTPLFSRCQKHHCSAVLVHIVDQYQTRRCVVQRLLFL